MSKFARAIMNMIARQLPDEEVADLLELWEGLDDNSDGTVPARGCRAYGFVYGFVQGVV